MSAINPVHYRSSASGVECIEITRYLSFSLGNAVKYLWRLGRKDDPAIEVGKALWYLNDELERLQQVGEEWIRPLRPGQWQARFRKHIETVDNYDVRQALDYICWAVWDRRSSFLRDAQKRLESLL